MHFEAILALLGVDFSLTVWPPFGRLAKFYFHLDGGGGGSGGWLEAAGWEKKGCWLGPPPPGGWDTPNTKKFPALDCGHR